MALTGAGCSTGSGIPDYRDAAGEWKRKPPVRFQEFMSSPAVRRRYWARSLAGWQLVRSARPNPAHRALATLEKRGPLKRVITQNVDRLHQQAGSREVIDLHGRVDRVRCLDCDDVSTRDGFQSRLEAENPSFRVTGVGYAPDGDADIRVEGEVGPDLSTFCVPGCSRCDGVLKPDVVFFGESVPRERVEVAMRAVDAGDALLVVGSSLMVWSGYRFVKRAVEEGIPVAALNLGKTRADDELHLKVEGDCASVLAGIEARLNSRPESG